MKILSRMLTLLGVLLLALSIMGCGADTSTMEPPATLHPSASPSPLPTPPPVSPPTTDPAESSQPVTIVDEELSQYFAGYEGCFVLFDQDANQYTVYNEQKSQKGMSPCSSFKIVNALIGLETGVLTDENTVFEWNGTKYSIESWNQDQTLQSAVTNSCVWYFQRVASEVGEERMQEYLDRIESGNKDISGGITEFWLMSSLLISPMEQVDMLRDMYNYQLPFSQRSIDIVKRVITLYDADGIRLSGKTGSGMGEDRSRYSNGWFVGYVEKEGNVYFFATNIEPDGVSGESAGGIRAKEITLAILKDKNLYL